MPIDNMDLIKRESGELVVLIDHKIENWGDGVSDRARLVIRDGHMILIRDEETIGESRKVYTDIIEALVKQDVVKVIMLPDGDSMPILNICRVVVETSH